METRWKYCCDNQTGQPNGPTGGQMRPVRTAEINVIRELTFHLPPRDLPSCLLPRCALQSQITSAARYPAITIRARVAGPHSTRCGPSYVVASS